MIWVCSHLLFLKTQHFFVNDGKGIGQFLNMSISQSEANAKTPPAVNQGDVPHACRGHFPLTDFFCPQIAEYVKRFLSAWQLSAADVQTWLRYIFHAGSSSPRPFDRNAVHRSSTSHLRFTERPPVCVLGGFPVKTQAGRVQVVSTDGDVQMKHKQQRC